MMRELEMRHPQTNVPPKTGVLFARSGHPQRSDLTLVAKVSSIVVGVLSVEDDQAEAEEEKVVVSEKEHLRRRTLQLPKA